MTDWFATGIDYSYVTYWSTTYRLTGASPSYIIGGEEGITPQERGLGAVLVVFPSAGDVYHMRIPFGSLGRSVPDVPVIVSIPYIFPSAGGGVLTIRAYWLIDGVPTAASSTASLPYAEASAPAMVNLEVPASSGAVASASLDMAIEIVSYTGGGAVLYPFPASFYAGPGICVGPRAGYGVPPVAPDWLRSVPMLLLVSPHVGTHASPTEVAGPPVLKFLTKWLYPTDLLTLTVYNDSPRNASHAPLASRTVFANVPVWGFAPKAAGGTDAWKYLEVGNSPYLLPPPDAEYDSAPEAISWAAGMTCPAGRLATPTFMRDRVYEAQAPDGVAGSAEPDWPFLDGELVADSSGTFNWLDRGSRYLSPCNTYYELTVEDANGTTLTTYGFEAQFDRATLGAVAGTISAPRVAGIAGMTSDDEVTLQLAGSAKPYNTPARMEVRYRITGPDGTQHELAPGQEVASFFGRLPDEAEDLPDEDDE